jgi:hypothetical protein
MSLCSSSSPRATEPKTRTLFAPMLRANDLMRQRLWRSYRARWPEKSVRGAAVTLISSIAPQAWVSRCRVA